MPRKRPDQMFEHGIDVKKGWFHMAALDFQAKLHEDVEFDLPAGRIVHVAEVEVDDNGKPTSYFKPGCHATGPSLTLINGSADFDVANEGTTNSGGFMHKAVMPGGELTGLVHTAGYEIESTEYDDEQTYSVNQLLTSRQGVADAANAYAGVLTNQRSGGGVVRAFQEAVCGIVSTGEHLNHNRIGTLAYWTFHLPGSVY